MSFSQALNELDTKGKRSDVVSKKPDDFGYLDFSYSLNDSNNSSVPYYVYTSSLDLQYDPKTGVIDRPSNTFFPYNKDKLISRNKSFGIDSGITVNQQPTDLNSLFIIDEKFQNPFWNYNLGETLTQPVSIGGFNNKYAVSYSFVDSKNNSVLFNPANMIFNSDGILMTLFDKGTLNNSPSFAKTFNKYNKAMIDKIPNIYDSTGLGIVTDPTNPNDNTVFFNRCIDKGTYFNLHDVIESYPLDPSDYKLWQNTNVFYYDVFSHFLKISSVTPYKFNLNIKNSSGPVKDLIVNNPNVFEQAFNKIFYGNSIKRANVPGNKMLNNQKVDVNPSIKLVKEGQYNYSIWLGVNEDTFVDFNKIKLDPTNLQVPLVDQLNQQKQEQIKLNKNAYLNNFRGFLSSKFSEVIRKIYLENLKESLAKENIQINEQSEYYYLDPKTKQEYLFVSKSNNGHNDIVIEQGNNIHLDHQVNELRTNLKTIINGEKTTNTFYALNKIIKMNSSFFPEAPKTIPNKISKDNSKYLWFQLLLYCNDKVKELLDANGGMNQPLNDAIANNTYFKIFLRLLNTCGFSFKGNVIESSFYINSFFTPLNFESKYFISLLNNYLCVINSAYAIDNKKKYLAAKPDEKRSELWLRKIDEINKLPKDSQLKTFTDWVVSIKNNQEMILNQDEIKIIFSSNNKFFDVWLTNLPNDYKIFYQNNTFLINGFGLSPEYAYPSISPTSPIPTPNNQAIIYLNVDTYNSLDVSDVNKFNYYTYNSLSKNSDEIIKIVNNYCQTTLKEKYLNPTNIDDAQYMYQIWIRTYFPQKINNLIIIFSVIGSVVLVLLSIVVVYLLLKSFIKNMLEPISLCMGNGVSLWRIIAACMMNLGIVTTLSTMISYVVAYFVQTPIIGIFSTIWLVPNTVALPFSPIIFLPLVIITFLIFSGLLSLIIYSKFKKPIPEIIANKQDIRTNKLTNILRNNKLRLTSLFKLTIGYSSINIGRLVLLSLLGATALGGIVSATVIKQKFTESKYLTNQSKQYNFEYQFLNINESSGLLKPQKFSEMGQEDQTVGINSIYLSKAEFDKIEPKNKLPYFREQTILHKLKEGGNENTVGDLTEIPNKYLSNMIMPSWNTYNYIVGHKITSLFNGCASIFLLDLPISFIGQKINIWEFVKGNFPTWVVTQLESQSQLFQNSIMDYYGEWYYKFIDINKQSKIIDEDNNDSLEINNISKNINAGYYYAETTTSHYRTKPYYLWVDGQQWYNAEANLIKSRTYAYNNQNVLFNFNRSTDFYDRTNKQVPINNTDKVVWKFVPAYDFHHQLNEKQIALSSSDLFAIRFSDAFIKFITTIYADERVSNNDSKISFGIVPYDPNIDESFSGVKAKILRLTDIFNKSYIPKEANIDILGIKPNSKYIQLVKDNKDLSHLLTPSNSNVINVVINNGAALKYNLNIKDTFDADILNNSLSSSFKVVNDMMSLNAPSPINNKYTFKVVGINDDSFGTRFYINQLDANRILGLNDMRFYSSLNPLSSFNPTEQNANNFVPFNGVFSKNKDLLISNKSIPFYTFANLWTIWTRTNQVASLTSLDTIFDSLLSHNPQIITTVATNIKEKLDHNFNYIPNEDINITRTKILNFIKENYSSSAILKTLNDIDQKDLLQSALSTCMPTNTSDQMFDMIANLSTTLIVIIASIIIPLLLIVTLITSLSIVNDLTKNLGLMKILGFSNRNIIISFVTMFSFVLLVTILLGLGIMFACTYGLQYLVFNLTTIFITSFVQPSIFFIGVAASILIFALTILFIALVLKRKGIENSIKF